MTSTDFENYLGRAISPQELANFLGIDRRTVIKYCSIWGGVEVTPGTWRFFEKRILEVLNAEQGYKERHIAISGKRDNFAGMPYTSGYSSTQKLWIQKISVGFSTQVINPLTSQGVAVVDLLCNGQFNSSSIFSSDGFHPNDTGYAILADLMMSAITSTSSPAPSSSCGQMTMVR